MIGKIEIKPSYQHGGRRGIRSVIEVYGTLFVGEYDSIEEAVDRATKQLDRVVITIKKPKPRPRKRT